MPDYKLHGLDPRTFQQLIQALALKEVGPGAIVYGDGADGARDATFMGRMNYPNQAAPWDGYLIIQAKFKQKPSGDTKKDGQWVREQLQTDLEKFISPRKGQKNPEYYILATNIDLTAKPQTGSDARVRQILEDYAPKLGIKGYDIWDGIKIQRLIDNHRDIALSYGGFITPGDVLAQILKQITETQPNLEQALSDYLQGELIKDQYARLREAGSTSERRTSLARVFIDLPVSDEPDSDPPEENEGDDGDEETDGILPLRDGFVKQVLNIGNLRLDRSSILEHRNKEEKAREQAAIEDGRLVLIGGPGQGKSTIGQYICQLYRAALLKERPQAKLSEDASSALSIILEQCSHDQIELPSARRFPVRIDLKHFADELAKQGCNSLLDYIAQRIDARTIRPVKRADLHTWLTAYPWLLILDGLDEVPASGNRGDVLDHIRQFSAQCATQGSDILVVATSRPQGYGDAFDKHLFHHQYLLPLSTRRALHYARRLVEVCHHSDPILRNDILARLERAATRTTTERLMRSPLQVTILAVLAELSGELPEDRFELFRKYYWTIFDRETQRGIVPLSTVLREHRRAIDRIHRIVGLRLQTASEIAGRNDAVLSKQDFESITNSQLTDSNEDDKANISATKQITEAALDRLVFLVSPRGDDIGFEIRSLQEFMAAEALMDGTDKEIHQRLQTIAPYPYWRNVFLFAAGKCATERDYMIAEIVNLCQTLSDESNPAAAATMAGAKLALDLLEDNTLHAHPKQRRAVAEIALRSLTLPTDSHQLHCLRLATVYQQNRGLDSTYTTNLRQALSASTIEYSLNAWTTLTQLISAGHSWASSLANEFWPSTTTNQTEIIKAARNCTYSPWLQSKLIELLPKTEPQIFYLMSDEGPEWLKAVKTILFGAFEHKTISLNLNTSAPLEIEYTPLSTNYKEDWKNISEIPNPSLEWLPLIANARTLLEPTKECFAREIKILASKGWPPQRTYAFQWRINWVLAACLSAAQSTEDLYKISTLMESGQLQDRDSWLEQERTWAQNGVTFDFIINAPSFSPLFKNAPLSWVFLKAPWRRHSPQNASIKENTQALINHYNTINDPIERSRVSRLIISCLDMMSGDFDAGPTETLDQLPDPFLFETWISESQFQWLSPSILRTLPQEADLTQDWINMLNRIGLSNIRIDAPHSHQDSVSTKRVINAFCQNPHLEGLLGWIASIVQAQEQIEIAIPTKVLDSPPSADSRVQVWKLIMRLATGNLSTEETRSICNQLVSMVRAPKYKNPDNVIRIKNIIKPHANQQWTILLAAELVKRLPPNTRIASDCISFLEERLGEQTSPLHHPQSISNLGLTETLSDPIASKRK